MLQYKHSVKLKVFWWPEAWYAFIPSHLLPRRSMVNDVFRPRLQCSLSLVIVIVPDSFFNNCLTRVQLVNKESRDRAPGLLFSIWKVFFQMFLQFSVNTVFADSGLLRAGYIQCWVPAALQCSGNANQLQVWFNSSQVRGWFASLEQCKVPKACQLIWPGGEPL